MPRRRLESLLVQGFDTRTMREQLRLVSGMLRTMGYRKPLDGYLTDGVSL